MNYEDMEAEDVLEVWKEKYGLPDAHAEEILEDVEEAIDCGISGQVEQIEDEIKNIKYFLHSKIGSGGFGTVWKGVVRTDPTKFVAIKIINLEESKDDIVVINREIMALASGKGCPQLTEYLGSNAYGDKLWIIMEYIDGGSVQDTLRETKKGLKEEEIAYIVSQVLMGLSYLAIEQKFHRDLKAANILVSKAGMVKLADFGATAQLSDTTRHCTTLVGSPQWMAPEVFTQSKYDNKADIWSLGVTCLEMATGLPPYAGLTQAKLIRMIPDGDPPTLDNSDGKWSPAFIEFTKICLQKDPKARPTITELAKSDFIKGAKDSSVLNSF